MQLDHVSVTYDSPFSMTSKALLICSRGYVCVMPARGDSVARAHRAVSWRTWCSSEAVHVALHSSTMSSLLMYLDTIPGSSVRPRTPPNAEPFQTRPVELGNGQSSRMRHQNGNWQRSIVQTLHPYQ